MKWLVLLSVSVLAMVWYMVGTALARGHHCLMWDHWTIGFVLTGWFVSVIILLIDLLLWRDKNDRL